MPEPKTYRKHFDEDIERAQQMLNLADRYEADDGDTQIFRDVRYAGVAMAVGAMDAYFCDAYVDCLATSLKHYVRGQYPGELPSVYANRELPAGVALDTSRQHRPLWALRMVARRIMERENMLSSSRVKDEFNGILPTSHKLWVGIIDALIDLGKRRFTGVTPADLRGKKGKDREQLTKKATKCFLDRLTNTIQWRHDWAHNCGRPKLRVDHFTKLQAKARLSEIRDFVEIFDDHLENYRVVR